MPHWRAEEVLQFNGKAYPWGHMLTDYERWANATAPYEIDYQPGYEPWGISHRCPAAS